MFGTRSALTLGLLPGLVSCLLLRRLLLRAECPDQKDGGGILVHPRAYLGRVFLPSLVSWVASLGVIAVAEREQALLSGALLRVGRDRSSGDAHVPSSSRRDDVNMW
jgi:hypothetical protein